MRALARAELDAPPADVWALVGEPYHLPDWWPAYTGVAPDRRGLAENARWRVVRAPKPGLLRGGGAEGLIVITRVAAREEFRWRDLDEGIEAAVRLESAPDRRTTATVSVRGPWWRLHAARSARTPTAAAARLHELCQTAATL